MPSLFFIPSAGGVGDDGVLHKKEMKLCKNLKNFP